MAVRKETLRFFGKTHIKNYYYKQQGVSQDSFALPVVCVEDVCKVLKSVDKTKAAGLDNIPARFVSDVAECITPSITHIINRLLQHGKVPSNMKITKVTSLHTKGSKMEAGNYRPVLILSIISDILERVVYNQLYEHTQSNN